GLKIDWNISDKHRANFRYAQSKQSTAFLQGFGSNSLALSTYHYVQDFEFKTYTAQLFSDWTDNFSTEAKVSYRDYSAVRNPQFDLPAKDDPEPRLPVQGWITADTARKLFADLGQNLDQLYQAAGKRGFKAIPLQATASVDLK
ncbi:hypothetical protein RNT82_12595, partial [Staphylococcus pseudintermedius]